MLTEPVSILLLHAFPFDSRMWRDQVQALSPNVRVIAPDMRGFGRNHRSPLFESIDLHAKDIVAQLDQHQCVRALVVGLSMGGYVAMAMSRLFPHRVAGLLLANTRAEADSEEAKQQRNNMIRSVEQNGTALLPNLMIHQLVSPNCPDSTRTLLRTIMLEQHPLAVIAALKALRDRPDARGGLRQVHCPTTVLASQLDPLSPPHVMQPIADAIEQAEFRIIPDAGHMSNLQAPAAFLQAIKDVYERVMQASRNSEKS